MKFLRDGKSSIEKEADKTNSMIIISQRSQKSGSPDLALAAEQAVGDRSSSAASS